MSATYAFKADAELHAAIQTMMSSDGLTASQACRALIAMGLANVNKLDEAWRRTALKEGRFDGISEFRSSVGRVFKSHDG